MKKSIILTLLFMLLFSFTQPSMAMISPNTTDSILESQQTVPLDKWMLDEANGFIYGFMENKLTTFSKDSLEAVKEVELGVGDLIDVEVQGAKVFILKGSNIYVYDSMNLSIERVISLSNTNNVHYRNLTVYSNKILVSTFGSKDNGQSTAIIEIDLTTGTKRDIDLKDTDNKPYNGTLEIDKENQILYVGSDRHVAAFSLPSYSFSQKTSYLHHNGFSHRGNLIIDKDDLFIGHYKLNKFDINQVYGYYHSDNHQILSVNDNYVITTDGIFHRETYQEVQFEGIPSNYFYQPYYSSDSYGVAYHLLDDENNLYMYSLKSNKIMKININQTEKISEESYIQFENGIETGKITSSWILDDTTNIIYLIDMFSNKLYYIDAESMSILHEMYIGNRPSDIQLYNNKLYVALSGSTQIAVADANYTGNVDYIYLKHPIFYRSFEVGNNKVFFTVQENEQIKLAAYDLTTKGTTYIPLPNIAYSFNLDLLLDAQTNLLYVGDRNGNLSLIDLRKLNIIESHQFPYVAQYHHMDMLVKIDEQIFFGQYQINSSNLANPLESLKVSEFIYATDDYIFSSDSLYDRELKSYIAPLPYRVFKIVQNENGEFIIGSNFGLAKYETINDFGVEWDLLPEDYEVTLPESYIRYIPIDIDDHWATEELFDLVASDMVTGYRDQNGFTILKPNTEITRAELAAILVRILGLTDDQGAKDFTDVKPGRWFYEAVRIANANGIVGGVSENKFEPDRPIRRDEIAVMITRAFEQTIDFSGTPKEFTDVSSYWAKTAIDKASSVGIIGGMTSDKFAPKSNAKRSEAITMLYRALHLEASDLPSDEDLENVILQYETNMNHAFKQYDFDQGNTVTDNYSTGYYNEWEKLNNRVVKDMYNFGVQSEVILLDSLSAAVIDKSNRYAAVELQGSLYQLNHHKHGLTQSSIKDSSGIYFLKKMDNGQWKIYNAYLPYAY